MTNPCSGEERQSGDAGVSGICEGDDPPSGEAVCVSGEAICSGDAVCVSGETGDSAILSDGGESRAVGDVQDGLDFCGVT